MNGGMSAREYFLGKDKILANEILPEVKKQFKKNKTETLFLRADFTLPYGKVAKLMSFLKRGGISQIALVTVTEDK